LQRGIALVHKGDHSRVKFMLDGKHRLTLPDQSGGASIGVRHKLAHWTVIVLALAGQRVKMIP
jgi:hypothetical protein